MFDPQTEEFTDTRSCPCHESDGKITFLIRFFFEALFQVSVFLVRNDVLQEGLFLDFYELDFEFVFPDGLQVFVQRLYSQVDGFRTL